MYPRNTPATNRGFIAAVILITITIAAIGIYATFKVGATVQERQEEKLLLRAKNAAILINSSEIAQLSGNDSDLAHPVYFDLKEKMAKLKKTNSDARFFYLMGLRDDSQFFFFLDSEEPGSADYSAPGDPFNEPEPGEIEDFKNGNARVQGPYTDSWGTWVSASAPIIDETTGATIATIGIDIDAQEFQAGVRNAKLLVGGITLFLALFLLYLILYIKKSHELISAIRRESDEMSASYSYLKEAETIAELGRFSLNTSNGMMDLDESAFDVLGIPKVSKPDYELVLSRIDSTDREKVKKVIAEAVARGLDSFKINFKVVGDPLSKTVLMAGTVRGSQNGKTARVVGTIQDISGNAA